ncbi:hypothetical protein Hdeb2414_s0014g00431121 [Helianthus debilis subsp. tardiflorus]
MENKHPIVSFVFFIWMLYAVDFAKSAEKSLTMETYSKYHFRKTRISTKIKGASNHRRPSIPENFQGGQVDVCADIISPKWNMKKEGNSPCPELVVWVPKKTGFTEFVKVNQQSKIEGGFSIAVFCYALQRLPFKVQPIFKPFINEKGESNGTYDQLLQHIEGKTCEAVAGDVTIRASRTQYVDFTIPYMSSDVYMLVHAVHEWNQTLWTLLRPFTWRLWITIVGACIYTGVAVAFLEYRVGNPKFTAPILKRIIMVIWFPISTFFFHEGKILNKNSKVVLIMWLTKGGIIQVSLNLVQSSF